MFTTDIHQRFQTSYTTLCNGVVVSHGARYGGLWVFADHTCKNTCKTNAFTIFARCAKFCACLSSRSDRGTYAPDEPRLFCLREKPKDPKFGPMPGSRWCRFWDLWPISVMFTKKSHSIQVSLCCTFSIILEQF